MTYRQTQANPRKLTLPLLCLNRRQRGRKQRQQVSPTCREPPSCPAPEVVARLEASGIDVRRTDREGTLLIEVSRDGLWRVRSAAEPFSAQTRVNLREE